MLCRVQRAQQPCHGGKGDELVLAGGEGLPGHSALRVALEEQPDSRSPKSIPSQCHLQSLMVMSRHRQPSELPGVCGEHLAVSLTPSCVSQA